MLQFKIKKLQLPEALNWLSVASVISSLRLDLIFTCVKSIILTLGIILSELQVEQCDFIIFFGFNS